MPTFGLVVFEIACDIIAKYCIHIWNQHGKYIKINTNKPMFGPVVLEIACDIFTNNRHFSSISTHEELLRIMLWRSTNLQVSVD